VSRGIEFATPRDVRDVADCFFYHVMDLPGIGQVGEHWDLRETVDAYLGGFDFHRARALDVGAASGFLTFEMERRGANVVSFDLRDGREWNVVPHAIEGLEAQAAEAKQSHVQRLQNGYWLAHRVLGSRAQVYYGDVYRIPQALGPFDVVVLGAILLHLRDPFLALSSAARVSRDAIIVTDPYLESKQPVMRFLPDASDPASCDAWWAISEPCMIRMLEILGFGIESVARHDHLAVYPERRCVRFSTYVARRRTSPMDAHRHEGTMPSTVSRITRSLRNRWSRR
jgi:hypothetical protein